MRGPPAYFPASFPSRLLVPVRLADTLLEQGELQQAAELYNEMLGATEVDAERVHARAHLEHCMG